ncbi:NACHT domain-containing protein [Burkholderia cepacia]|uniref:NACHT domain-containing protein n=1 Tax=Burkholderia cepacia TaxID=292 RepID=UPI002AB7EE6A|nr:NACHT domain-containing protein [Burkholderia cepacia]
MNKNPNLRLLASSIERGDLFTRLVQDLFFALGYHELRLNVHKTGREIDVEGQHRYENRSVFAECKATEERIGGSDLNKFLGTLTRERIKNPHATGYFVSLSGFTESGIQQEIDSGPEGLILLNASSVTTELERHHAIVSRDAAVERAGRCIAQSTISNAEFDSAELLGHERGYIWVVFYATDKFRSAFALIHADGQALGEDAASEIIEADRNCGGTLHTLQFIPAPAPERHQLDVRERALSAYRRWLGEEFGYIQLDGLPADSDLSATRLRLERLFVPLRAVLVYDTTEKNHRLNTSRDDEDAVAIGRLMEEHRHLALLAMPGGGKSTLLKRLATAYSFPERMEQVPDNLPEGEHLPLILRCRELRDRSHRPILELIFDIPRHAALSEEECLAFEETVHESLRSGSVLLLVDGLDEISEEGARLTFATHLRTFIAMFPLVRLVVTSREAGFRVIAGVIASACSQARFASLNRNEAIALCERWHVEVVADTSKVKSDATELGSEIWENHRIRTLARNPLLLTTLLVVKRNVGELPRNRTALYREAIRVLVRTWNVEGYAAMDEEETLAQLSYVACEMTRAGQQQIGERELLRLLYGARKELQAELQFTDISPQSFINRIEYRSSLLMQTGFVTNDNQMEAVYEFRHLTFQEYLAARGFTEEQYAGRDDNLPLVDILEPRFQDAAWREVISLSAVLAGRKAEGVIKRLVERVEEVRNSEKFDIIKDRENATADVDALSMLLLQCLRDEVQLTPSTLRRALTESVLVSLLQVGMIEISGLLAGKFGGVLSEIIKDLFFDAQASGLGPMQLLSSVVAREHSAEDGIIDDEFMLKIMELFSTDDIKSQTSAALLCMNLAFRHYESILENKLEESNESEYIENTDDRATNDGELNSSNPKNSTSEISESIEQLRCFLPNLDALLFSENYRIRVAAAWALAWYGATKIDSENSKEISIHLFRLSRCLPWNTQEHFVVWAFLEQQLADRDGSDDVEWGVCDEDLVHTLQSAEENPPARAAALVVGWYRGGPWNDEEIVSLCRQVLTSDDSVRYRSLSELLIRLGQDPADFVISEDKRESDDHLEIPELDPY